MTQQKGYILLIKRGKTWQELWADDLMSAQQKATDILNEINSHGIMISPDGYRSHLHPRTTKLYP